MTDNNTRTNEEDAWFYDLGEMARRIEVNEARHRSIRHRLYVIYFFTVLAFTLVAYRTELNSDAIMDTQRNSCTRGVIIIGKFNALQDELARLEATNTTVPAQLRDARITAYENARILPLPACPPK